MPVTVRTGPTLKDLLGGVREAQADAATVGELLDRLGIRPSVCSETGALRRHVNIHVNEGEDVRFLQGLDTPVRDGDTVMILSGIAGG